MERQGKKNSISGADSDLINNWQVVSGHKDLELLNGGGWLTKISKIQHLQTKISNATFRAQNKKLRG